MIHAPGWTDSGLAGTYTFGFGWDRANHQTSMSYPTVGGMPGETVTTAYNTSGYATSMAGRFAYVPSQTYRAEGWPLQRQLGNESSIITRNWQFDDATGRLTGLSATSSTAAAIQNLGYTYDAVGNPTSENDAVAGQRQCYTHDNWQRLILAYSVASARPCSDGTADFAGPAPYNDRYTYDTTNRITSFGAWTGVNQNGVNSYTYADPAHPHAPTAIATPTGTDSYTYDAVGNRASYTDSAGDDFTYAWDNNGRLTAAINTTTVATTDYRYDIDRQVLLQRSPNGTVQLYLHGGALEVKDTSTSAVYPRFSLPRQPRRELRLQRRKCDTVVCRHADRPRMHCGTVFKIHAVVLDETHHHQHRNSVVRRRCVGTRRHDQLESGLARPRRLGRCARPVMVARDSTHRPWRHRRCHLADDPVRVELLAGQPRRCDQHAVVAGEPDPRRGRRTYRCWLLHAAVVYTAARRVGRQHPNVFPALDPERRLRRFRRVREVHPVGGDFSPSINGGVELAIGPDGLVDGGKSGNGFPAYEIYQDVGGQTPTVRLYDAGSPADLFDGPMGPIIRTIDGII